MLTKEQRKGYTFGTVWIGHRPTPFYEYIETGPDDGKVLKVKIKGKLIRVAYSDVITWPTKKGDDNDGSQISS